MADTFVANPGVGGNTFASDDIGGVHYPRSKVCFGADGSATDVSTVAPLPVILGAGDAINAANSSTSVLAGAGVFTGTSFSTLGYSTISVSVHSSHASATDGLSIQQSTDGTNWDNTDVYTIPAATGKTFNVNTTGAFGRVVYTNGATLQTTFRLQTILRVNPFTRGSVQRPQDARTNDNDFDESLAYAMLYNGTTWDRMRGDTTNGLDVDVTRLSALVAGTAAIGDVGIQYRASATGAASSSHLVSAATTNATVIKASAGRLIGWSLSNTTASAKFVKFHNTASAPTPGAGVVRTVMIPANGNVTFDIEGGIAHSTGIGITITGAVADADTTAVALGDVVADIFYA